MRRCTLLLLTTLSLLTLAACGGRPAGHSAAPTATVPVVLPAGAPQTAQAPALPSVQPFIAQRMASTAQAQQNGSDAVATSAVNATAQGTLLKLNSDAATAADSGGWGLYRFDGAPGEKLEAAGFSSILRAHPFGQHYWVGISNYAAQRWDWFDGGVAPAGEIALSGSAGAYSTPTGQTYVLLLAYGGMIFDVDKVYLRYTSRQPVTGVVRTGDGTPIPGALVACTAFQQSSLTASDGSFSFNLPNGDWPLVVTKDSYTFYSNPLVITVNNAPLNSVAFIGRQNGSHFVPDDPGGNDNTLLTAVPVDFAAGAYSGRLSATDDIADCISFTVAQPGPYFVEFQNPGLDVYFPYLTLYNASGTEIMSVPSPVAGTLRIPLVAGEPFTPYFLKLTCSGGGGAYSLSFSSGQCQHLHGTLLTTGAAPLDGCLVSATNIGQGDVTQYFTAQDGTFDDLYRAPVPTLVEPSGVYLSFVPSSHMSDLSLGPDTTCDFVGTTQSLGDMYEPNSTASDASVNASLTLPYDSTVAGDSLSATAGSDPLDFYKVAPASGLGLKVELTTDTDYSAAGTLGLSLLRYDGFTTLATGHPTPHGMEVRLPGLTDGNVYYVRVSYQALSVRTRAYNLKVDSYSAYPLKFAVDYGAGTGVANAVIQLRQQDDPQTLAYDVYQLTTANTGQTTPLFCAAGEVLQAELLRYGFNTDRYTQTILMPAKALTVSFTADPAQSLDQLEPNDETTAPMAVSLPAAFDATLDPRTDPKDLYQVSLNGTDPLLVTLTPAVPVSGHFRLALINTLGTVFATVDVSAGSTTQTLLPPSGGGWVLEVDDPGVPCSYHLELANAPAFHIKGGAPGPAQTDTVVVYCPELQRFANVDSATKAYDFGLVAPGAYTVQIYCRGFAATPPDATVDVVDADVTQDFTMAAQNVDGLEPNDTAGAAAAVPTDGSLSASLSIGSGSGMSQDTADWYKFDATAGQTVHVVARRGQAWWPLLQLQLFDPGSNPLAAPIADGADLGSTFLAPATGSYTFKVTGGPVDYSLAVRVSN